MSPIVEVSEQTFHVEDGGELRPDPFDIEQHRRGRRPVCLFGHECVALGFHRPDLLEQPFEPVKLTADLRLEMARQSTAVAVQGHAAVGLV